MAENNKGYDSEMNASLEIDLMKLLHKLWSNRKYIYKSIITAFIIAIIICFSIPKRYTTNVILSPESAQASSGSNGLANMASMLGIGNIGGGSQDALNSSMAPEILGSTPFIIDLYNINITTTQSSSPIPLYNYLKEEKQPWWNYIMQIPATSIKAIKSLFTNRNENITNQADSVDPFNLTKEQSAIIQKIKSSLSATIDKKSGMITISASFQDPIATAIIADSVIHKLQRYIITYRTRKTQEDCNYLERICKERKQEYYNTQQKYASFIDTNRNVISQRTQAEATRLQNEMSIAYQIYSQVETQLQIAQAKVQESKPVFAILEPAAIPLHPSSPNKIIIIVAFIFIAFIGSIVWIFTKETLHNIHNELKNYQ